MSRSELLLEARPIARPTSRPVTKGIPTSAGSCGGGSCGGGSCGGSCGCDGCCSASSQGCACDSCQIFPAKLKNKGVRVVKK